MPIDPWIPLAGRPLQLPSINEQLHVREFARQMQVRNQIMQLNSTPGMTTQDGLYTNQGLMALGSIDPATRDETVRNQAQIMAQRSLEYHRTMDEQRKQIEESQEIEKQANLAAIAAYNARQGSIQDKTKAGQEARNAHKKKYVENGQSKGLGWNDQSIQNDFSRPFSYHDAILQTMGPEKGMEEIRYRSDIEREQEGKKKVMEYTSPKVEGISTEGLPLSDVDKAIQSRGLTQEPPIEQRELGPEKQHVEPPEPKEQPKEQAKEQPRVPGLEPREIVATKPETTVEGLYARAAKLREMADNAQSPKRRKELLDEANRAGQRAEGLDRAINAERRTDQGDERLKLAVQRAAATQQPLDPRTVKLLSEAVARGNYAIATGLARNQVAQRQLKDGIGEYAREHNWSAQDLNRAHQQFSAAMKAQAGFTAGQEARNITAINTAIGHMGTMSELSDALATSNSQAINAAVNAVSKQFGDPSITNFEIAKSAVSNELMRVFRQVGASETEVLEWEKKFKASQTPDQIRGGLNTASKLLNSRINALKDQAKRAGVDIPEILSPEAEQSLKNISGKVRFKPGTKSQPGELDTPRSNPQVAPYDDPEKERRYQEWKKQNAR